MVFCGKPSGGCHSCRKKKTRCDQRPDGCSQCKRARRECPGYRVPGDVIFRNESDNVIKKFKAKEARTKAASKPLALIPSNPTTTSSDGVPEESMEVVRQCATPILSYSLAQPIEDRATLFFVTNYVIGEQGPTRGHLDYLSNLYQTDSLDEGLMASMKAVGLAGYSHAIHAPSLMKNARYHYTRALQLTNAALRSPGEVKKDTILIAIMVLSIFETVTGSNQRSISAWAEHVAGASALLKLRGREQLKTPGGRRMFIQVVSSLMMSSIQRGIPLPDYILEWTKEARQLLNTPGEAWIVQEMMMTFTNFRASIIDGSCSDPEVILVRSLDLDNQYLSLFRNIPQGWEYETVFVDSDSDLIYNGRYHIYYDYWIAQMWNSMRSVRVLLNEQIRDVLLKGFSTKPPLFNKPEHTTQFQISTDTLYEMQADILASVPQHLGIAPHSTPFSSSSNKASRGNDQALAISQWSNFSEYNEESFPVVRASGSYFLLWPLWFAGIIDITTEPIKQYVTRSLRVIGETMGIQQALFLAEVIETRSEIRFNEKG